ncbi:hypothetical protein [uncultured Campylobacter sp.]|uniref:hypothetical protein n=1 Tax=uncultured Campylobacter sp. TaxID=218934 RepID=UPI002615C8AF|nr:hypothetical protein [uncultured Campylobacter sp.]
MSIDTKKLVLEVLSNLANDYDIDEFKTADENTKIYTGFGGKLDSLGMVNLVAELEDVLSSMLDKEVILADDKMMSSRNSPLKDVKSLIEYVDKKIKEL